MVYSKFTTGVIFRVIILVISIFTFAYFFVEYNDLLINLNFIALVILETILLIKYVNQTNNSLTNFFMSVGNDDTMLSFSRKKTGKSFENLYEQLDRINEHIQDVKIELNNQEMFNRLIISQVNIGIIVIDSKSGIKLHNDTALHLLGLQVFTHLSQLNKISEGLDVKITNLEPAESITIRLVIKSKIKQFLFRVNYYKQNEELLRLVSFQDIKQELDIKEMESWQKLIRILTHEITNSISPINSTIDTISGFFTEENGSEVKPIEAINQPLIDNAVKGIGIIKDRSIGMLDFVQKFRDLTLIPKPELSRVNILDLLESIVLLFEDKLKARNIHMEIDVNPVNIELLADKSMIEQVMINLLLNAMEADSNTIALSVSRPGSGKVSILITDDGKGIEKEVLENIFVPFFTTKQEGSGIGLSLSREIIRMHNGMISVNSTPGEGTEFELSFNVKI